MALQYQAEFDAGVAFSDGGGLEARRFRIDVPRGDVTEAEIAALFVASLHLRAVERVDVTGIRIFAEPKVVLAPAAPRTRCVELSHVISAGLMTYPGLPGPEITPHLTREASRGSTRAGTEFAIDRMSMVGNTGTYLDSPFHRYADGDRPGRAAAGAARRPAGRRGPHGGQWRREVSTWTRWPIRPSPAGPCCCTPAATGTGARRRTRSTRRT